MGLILWILFCKWYKIKPLYTRKPLCKKKVNKAICKIRFCIFCQVCKNFLIWQSASAFQCSGAIKKLFFHVTNHRYGNFCISFTTMINVCAKFIAKNCGNIYTKFVHNIFFSTTCFECRLKTTISKISYFYKKIGIYFIIF